jgi:hypothetical protein
MDGPAGRPVLASAAAWLTVKAIEFRGAQKDPTENLAPV